MTTYWFVIGWFGNQRAQKSKVKQAAKDVIKSKVYPQRVLKYIIVVVCTLGQCTTWSLPIVLHIGVLLFLK